MVVQRLVAMLLALWAGSLVTVCGIAAPSLFAVLPDRHAAGQVAARLFLIEMIIGVVVSACALIASVLGRVTMTRTVTILIIVAAIGPVASEVLLGPMMESARRAGDMARFGALHGVSALLFASACVCSIVALWLFNRPAT